MPNKGTAKRRAPKGVLGRLIRTLFGFYPVLLPVTVACILFNAVVSSVPSIFMQNVIAAVEQSWQSGDWSAVSGRILGLVALLAVFYVLMFLYVRFSGRRSKAYYKKQQDCLGELDGYIEEMMAGQKVVKVFNHEEESLRAFREKNEALRKAGTGAQSYAATMIPAVVSISYVNYALVAVLGGIMALKGMTDVGSLASGPEGALRHPAGSVRPHPNPAPPLF